MAKKSPEITESPKTLHRAALVLLAMCSANNDDVPHWLRPAITGLGEAINREAIIKSKSTAVNKPTGRPPSQLRKDVEKALLEKKTQAVVKATTGASDGLITAVRAELRADGKLPARAKSPAKKAVKKRV